MAIRKVTARNSEFLAAAKQMFNRAVYRAMSEIMNGPEPEETAIAYLRLRELPTDPIAFLQGRNKCIRRGIRRTWQ